MGDQKDGPAYASEQEENDDYAQYKIGRHTAGDTAKGKEGQGEEDIAEGNKEKPAANGVQLKAVADKHQSSYRQGDAEHNDNQEHAGSHNNTGYGSHKGGHNTYSAYHIQHFRVQ
jgi:hypothetical protein